jgi:hypothetical protein
LGPICVLACMLALATYYWWRMFEGKDEVYHKRWYMTWVAKGVVAPIFFWMLLNMGRTPVMPALAPLLPPDSPNWFGRVVYPVAYVAMQTNAILVGLGSFWAALTFAWFALVLVQRMEERETLLTAAGVLCFVLLPVEAALVYAFGLGGLGFALVFWLWPVTHFGMSLRPMKMPPSYSRAVGQLKQGKYAEAERAIIGELEKSETDFDGWMMLAELYAKKFNDVGQAQRTVHELCQEPGTTVAQIAVALHRLADWQLELRDDPAAARRALEEICARMPGTHLARMAALRISQLPRTSAELTEHRHAKTFALPALGDDLDEGPRAATPEASPEIALLIANECVEQLREDPNDVATREKLARIFAEQLGRTELAVEQLELLVEMPEQPAARQAEWLALMAAWHIKYGDDFPAAKKVLQGLIQEHPQSAQAFAAQRRLSLMEREVKPAPPAAGATLAANEAG